MAPKRAATLPERSASSSYSSDEEGDEEGGEEVETRRPSSPPKQKPIQKSSTTPLAPTSQPIVKPSQNRPPAVAASSDEQGDDEDDTDQEESSGQDGSGTEESDTDDARTNKQAPPPVHPPKKPQPQSPLPKPTPPEPPSDSGSSEGSDSGSDSSEEDATPAAAPLPSRTADPSIKPVNTKPMDVRTRSGKSAVSSAPTPGQDSLRRKGDSVDSSQKDNNGGRQFFQRLWSLDDEITLLNGLVEYRINNGCLPSRAGMDAVHDCIKGSLQMEVTSSQLVNKLRGLKKKFQTNVARQKNGTGPTFTKRQEQVAFELSRKLWSMDKVLTEDVGASPVNEDDELRERETKVNRKRKEGNLNPVDVSDLSYAINKKFKGTETGKSHYPLLWETLTKMADGELCGFAIKRALEMLDDVKANQMEEKLKKLRITQIKQHGRRADLDKETLKLIYDAIMGSC